MHMPITLSPTLSQISRGRSNSGGRPAQYRFLEKRLGD
jgi:hypothetical protein